jgi:hypothetical protein
VLAAIAAAVLGAVFLVSAITKLARPAQWRVQAAELVLDSASPTRAFDAVPVVEAVLGALLVVQWRRTAVALVAATVLVAFTALLTVRLLQGRHPACACFGTLSTKPIGWSAVARNAALIVLALVAALA